VENDIWAQGRDATGGQIKLYKVKLHYLYLPPTIRLFISRRKRLVGGTCGMNVRQSKCIQSFGRETGANYTTWKI
jgi:hypothetical protein